LVIVTGYLGKFKRIIKIILLRYVICVSLFYLKFKPLFMDKIQQLLTHFRMLRAATLMRLRGLQETENVNQEEVDSLLDQLNELQERIKILEAHLKNEGK
jgi:response regulator of citrate/malate metabolism